MALFRRKDSVPKPPTEVVLPDPPAFAPIPPPAPYKPAIYFPADLPQNHMAVQEDWARDIGDEATKHPIRRRRYASDTEYLRDLSTAAQDGIGHTTEGYSNRQTSVPDPRWAGVDPNLGKRPDNQVRNADKFTYFRPFEQDVARAWDGSRKPDGDPIPGHIRQGNYGERQWRLTSRFDPTSGETYDRTPAAASSRVTAYNAASTVRRTFRK